MLMKKYFGFLTGASVLVSCVYLIYTYLYVYIYPPLLRQTHEKTLLNVSNKQRYFVEPDVNRHNPFRGLIESNRLEKVCSDVNRTIKSETIPPFYPYEGTGKPADLSDDEFDTSHFRNYCSSNLSAIVTIYSAAENFDRRKAIRDTIGKQCELLSCKLLFLCGVSSDKNITDRVKDEYRDSQDIFIKNKIDTYADLNNKAVAMFDWLLEYCQQPTYVIHLVDDAFVNVKLYLQGLSKITDTQRYVYGKTFVNHPPHRWIQSKNYVSPKHYPRNRYPDFIVGISYAFPNSLTRELRCSVHKAKYVWLEDVWLLGEIKEYLGFKLIQSEYKSWHIDFKTLNVKNVRDYLYLHEAGVSDFYRFNDALGLV